MKRPLSLKKFKQRKVLMNVQEIGNSDTMGIYSYDTGCFIELKRNGMFYLTIQSSEWESQDLQKLEEILYKEWYIFQF